MNPILNSVLAGFGRRRRYDRFKCGQLNLHFNMLRFVITENDKDDDLKFKHFEKRTLHSTKVKPEQLTKHMQVFSATWRLPLRVENLPIRSQMHYMQHAWARSSHMSIPRAKL